MPYGLLLGATVGVALPVILPLLGVSLFGLSINSKVEAFALVSSVVSVALFSITLLNVRRFSKRIYFAACIFLVSFSLSLLIAAMLCQWRLTAILNDALPLSFHNTDAILEIDIKALQIRDDNSVRIRAKVLGLLSETLTAEKREDFAHSINGKYIQFSWKRSGVYSEFPMPAVGERWQFPLRLKSPRGFANPGGFNYRAWLLAQNIIATGYVKGYEIKKLENNTSSINASVRYHLNEILFNDLKLSHIGLFQALSFGIKDEITEQQWQVLRQTGTSHLMAISGLHVGLFALFGFLLGRSLCGVTAFISLKTTNLLNYLPLFFSATFAAFYAGLSGFSLPTQRAVLMVLVVNVAILARRKISPFTLLSVVWCVMVLHQPLSLLSPGLWLSFFAVASLFVFFMEKSPVTSRQRNAVLIQKVSVGVRVQGVLWACLVFVLIGVNAPISLISPIANFIAVPLVSLVVIPLVFLGLFSGGAATVVGTWVLHSADFTMGLLWYFLAELADHTPMLWQLNISGWAVFFGCVGMFLVFLPVVLHLRCVGLSLALLAWFWIPENSHIPSITVLDVGQGLSVVGQSNTQSFVYDTGAKFSASFDIGAQVLVPYLRYTGNDVLDLVILSHGDNDHSGGFDGLLKHISVNNVAANHALHVNEKIPQKQACIAGDTWQVGDFELEVIWPTQDTSLKKSNDQSCVVLVRSDKFKILLTGDIEKSAEYALLDVLELLGPIDVVLAPHHGSNTSSTYAFISAVQARHVVFSHGYKNRYRHPSAKVVERYKAFDTELWSTAEDGAITFRFANNTLDVVAERQHFSKPWFQAPYMRGESVKN